MIRLLDEDDKKELEGKMVKTVNGISPDENGNVDVCEDLYDAVFEEVEVVSANKFNPAEAEQKFWSTDVGGLADNTDYILSGVIKCNFGDTIHFRYLNKDNILKGLSTAGGFLVGEDGTVVYAFAGEYNSYTAPESHNRIPTLSGVRVAFKIADYASNGLTFETRDRIIVTVNEAPTEYVPFVDGVEKVNRIEKNRTELQEQLNGVATKSRWTGKNVLVFGDSISTDNYPVNDYRYAKWATHLKNTIGCNLYNYSVHGHGYVCGQGGAEQGTYNMINQIETANTELTAQNVTPDLVILFMGTNDYGNQVPMGAYGDGMYTTTYMTDTFLTPKNDDPSTITTFHGGVEHCMARIKGIWNNALVVVLTPLQRQYQYSQTEGMALSNYRDVIVETAKLFSYPVKDLYYEANFNPVNPYDRLKTYQFPDGAYAGQYDGLHPNEAFCRDVLMPTIWQFIEQI